MILLKSNMMGHVSNQLYPIKCFEVWFKTPKGLCSQRDEAITYVESMDMGEEAILPVPVAIDIHGHYEVMT